MGSLRGVRSLRGQEARGGGREGEEGGCARRCAREQPARDERRPRGAATPPHPHPEVEGRQRGRGDEPPSARLGMIFHLSIRYEIFLIPRRSIWGRRRGEAAGEGWGSTFKSCISRTKKSGGGKGCGAAAQEARNFGGERAGRSARAAGLGER